MPSKNPWITFLASYRKSNPGKSMKQAMRDGAKAYRANKGKAGKGKKSGTKKKL
jgi:hypothetical protein